MREDIPIYRVKLVECGPFDPPGRLIRAAADAGPVLAAYLEGADREHFVVLACNAPREFIGLHTVAVGSLDRVEVHPREVFKVAVLLNAASIIVGHNHPSNNLRPSVGDRALTRRLEQAGDILGIPVLAHVIVGTHGDYVVL